LQQKIKADAEHYPHLLGHIARGGDDSESA